MIHAGLRSTASLFTARRAPVAALGATAAVVIVIDEVSKVLALQLLPELDAPPTRFLQLGVVHNAGAESAVITAAAVLIILGFSVAVCSALASLDRAAPVMLGLTVGAGIANATDALRPPAGVVDWIAIGMGGGIVVNLADVAVLAGVCLCARTAYRLMLEIRRQRTPPDPSRIPP